MPIAGRKKTHRRTLLFRDGSFFVPRNGAMFGVASIAQKSTGRCTPAGNLSGVTASLNRIHAMGSNAIYLLPATPVGLPTGNHPAFGSPYCMNDFYGINSAFGSASDLKNLVNQAHQLGMKVILDQVLNHSAWDIRLQNTQQRCARIHDFDARIMDLNIWHRWFSLRYGRAGGAYRPKPKSRSKAPTKSITALVDTDGELIAGLLTLYELVDGIADHEFAA
jgi:glycosidase